MMDVTFDMHHYGLVNQIDVRRNGHGVTVRAADSESTAVLGYRAPLNPHLQRGKAAGEGGSPS